MDSLDQDRTRQNILALLVAVPLGRVTTAGALADASGHSPDEVLAVLRGLDKVQRNVAPWYRVVLPGGELAAGPHSIEQVRLLGFEGVTTSANRIDGFEERLHRFDPLRVSP